MRTDDEIIEQAKHYMNTIGNNDGSALFDFMKGAQWIREYANEQKIEFAKGFSEWTYKNHWMYFQGSKSSYTI